MLPTHVELGLYPQTITEQAANDMIPGIKIAGVAAPIRALLQHIFPNLDHRTTHNDIVLKDGDTVLLVTYTGNKLGYDGVPQGPYSVRYTEVQVDLAA